MQRIGAWFTILLAVFTVGVILKIIFGRLRISFILGCIAVATVIALNAVNVDALVARYNISRYNETVKIDVNYLFNDLSLSAGDELLKLAENEKDPIRQERFYNYLAGKCCNFDKDKKFGAWTFSEVNVFNKLMKNDRIASKVSAAAKAKSRNDWDLIDKYYFDEYGDEDEAVFK